MATIFAVYNLKENQRTDEYDNYLIKTKIPGIGGAPQCADFKTWKIDKVLGPAVSEPEGELPAEPPYLYLAKIEVSERQMSCGGIHFGSINEVLRLF